MADGKSSNNANSPTVLNLLLLGAAGGLLLSTWIHEPKIKQAKIDLTDCAIGYKAALDQLATCEEPHETKLSLQFRAGQATHNLHCSSDDHGNSRCSLAPPIQHSRK